jgi:hypothetical protein
MRKILISRRDFLGSSAGSGMAAVGASALADPAGAATQAVGIKRGDLPDLSIKQVKVYAIGAESRGGSGKKAF